MFVLRLLRGFHDWVTDLGYYMSAAALAMIVVAYTYEVVARYFFAAPTGWANDSVSYLLCVGVFLAVPRLAREGGHVAITIVLERAPKGTRRPLVIFGGLLSFVACAVAAWISADENLRQMVQGTETLATHPIPKWWVSVFITYGFAWAAPYFLRHLEAGPNGFSSQRVPPS